MEITMMMILWITVSCAAVTLLITLSTIYYCKPVIMVKLLKWYLLKLRGAKVEYFEHEGYTFCYFSRGKPGPQPSILMFHGFSLGKEMWLPIMNYIPKDVHVICVDLPGHGGTTRLPGESYTGIEQAKRIHQFVEYSGLNRKPFHLVGISMGGMVAGIYAALYPSDIHCLSLLCPAGLRYPTDNDFVKHLREMEKLKNFKNNPLVPVTMKQAEEMLKLVLYRPQNTNKQLLQGILDYRKPHVSFFIKCEYKPETDSLDSTRYFSHNSKTVLTSGFLDITNMESRFYLHDNITNIKAPTQVIWGKHDKVLDPAGGEIFANAIPSCQVHILEECGHFTVVDRPRKSIMLILEFYYLNCGIKKKKRV